MTYIQEGSYFRCDGCRGEVMPAHLVSFRLPDGEPGGHNHYHHSCWLTGWYTGIEPKGEWPVAEEPEPAFDHVKGEVRVTSSTGGQKGQKLARYDLLPSEALRQVAELYGIGASKYEPHNWRRGYDWSLSFAAMQRHAWQFWDGEDFDAESGSPHLASVVFHALAMLTFMDEHRSFDDRPRVANDDSVK